MKKNIGIVGYGKWAKKIFPSLQKHFNIKFICNSKIDYKLINLKKIDWVFVLSNNETHYQILKYFFKKRVKIFCEKPLDSSFKKTSHLYKLAKKNKCKLYVDDVEFFKNKAINIKKVNKIYRFKKAKKSNVSLLHRLAYHDFYLFEKFINLKKISNIKLIENNFNLKVSFEVSDKKYHFYYKINSNQNIHKINNIDLLKFKKEPLGRMFTCINKENLDFINNKKRTLFSSKLISILKKRYK